MNRETKINSGWRFSLTEPPITARYRARFNVYAATRAGARCPASVSGYDDSKWKPVDIPHDWLPSMPYEEGELQFQGGMKRGHGWYRKEFTLPAETEGKNILLRFEGIAGNSEIYVNGFLIKRNFSSFNEITADITDIAVPGEKNAVAVYVDRSDIEKWAYEGAGIYRHVKLIIKDPVHLAENGIFPHAEPSDNNGWKTGVEVTVENSGYDDADFTAVLRITSPDGEEILTSETSGTVSACGRCAVTFEETVEHPALWDTENPALYRVTVEILSGASSDLDIALLGFRYFHADPDRGFFLNGRPLKLRGVCAHQDHAGIGVALPDSMIRYRMGLIKEMGCNAFRCSHHTQSRVLLDWCDENGIVVIDENREFSTSETAAGYLREQIIRDRVHPSVMFYAVFNEEPIAAERAGRRIYDRLAEVIRSLDGTRLLTGAMNNGTVFGEEGVGAVLDVTGFNYCLDGFSEFHRLHPECPIMGIEDAAPFSTRGQYVSDFERRLVACDDSVHKEAFTTIREAMTVTEKNDWICGTFIWSAFDYRGEAHLNSLPGGKSYPGWPAVIAQYGLMDLCGFPKGGYWFYRAFTDKKPFCRIIGDWNGIPGEKKRIVTVTNCDEVAVYLNGELIGRRENDIFVQNEWEIPFEAGELVCVGFSDGKEVCRSSVFTFLAPEKIALEPQKAYFDDDEDAFAVTVSAVDRNGHPVLSADNHVVFSVTGGKILGCGNGNPTSHESDVLPERNLFCGLCTVIVAPLPGSERITLKAEAKALIGNVAVIGRNG